MAAEFKKPNVLLLAFLLFEFSFPSSDFMVFFLIPPSSSVLNNCEPFSAEILQLALKPSFYEFLCQINAIEIAESVAENRARSSNQIYI